MAFSYLSFITQVAQEVDTTYEGCSEMNHLVLIHRHKLSKEKLLQDLFINKIFNKLICTKY